MVTKPHSTVKEDYSIRETVEVHLNQWGVQAKIGDEFYEHLVDDLTHDIKIFLHQAETLGRIDEIELVDKQFPDLWKRGKAKYTEKDMWKLAHYVANRPDELDRLLGTKGKEELTNKLDRGV